MDAICKYILNALIPVIPPKGGTSPVKIAIRQTNSKTHKGEVPLFSGMTDYDVRREFCIWSAP